eukprot:355911-Chlamydomonas_euryale.AAC.3
MSLCTALHNDCRQSARLPPFTIRFSTSMFMAALTCTPQLPAHIAVLVQPPQPADVHPHADDVLCLASLDKVCDARNVRR